MDLKQMNENERHLYLYINYYLLPRREWSWIIWFSSTSDSAPLLRSGLR